MEVKSNFNFEAAAAASREELQAAIAKAVELRAIHTALQQGTSPKTNPRFLSSPPLPRIPNNHPKISSAVDYPVFTPSYEDEPLPGYRNHIQLESRGLSPESWEDYGGIIGRSVGGRHKDADEVSVSQSSSTYMRKTTSSRKTTNHNNRLSCPPQSDLDCRSVTSSCTNPHNHISAFQTSSPLTEVVKSRRRNSLGDLNSVCSSCNYNNDHDHSNNGNYCSKHPSSNIIVPLTDSHTALYANKQTTTSRSRGGLNLSWLFPRSRKKNSKNSPRFREVAVREEFSQIQTLTAGRDNQQSSAGVVSIETLKKRLLDANQQKDSALTEVAEMRSSFGDLKRKLETLEKYCEDLKKALKQAVNSKQNNEFAKDMESANTGMPVSEEVMVEGFLQMVSESRLSVKQFCKTLVVQIESADDQLIDNLNSILQPYKLSITPRYMKAVLYHLEAMVNLALYQDFENCVFQKNGCPDLLDPEQARQAQFASFVALRNLSWNEVLKKGTKYYSEEFSRFCDQKMSCVISTLNWIRPWPEQLLQSFFVAAKCIWLLHLLAFSFSPPLTIMRVEDGRAFDGNYMEDMLMDRQQKRSSSSTQQGTASRVKIMVTPGFYVKDKILRCKVLCRYKSSLA